jgi:uncharacterized protein
MPIINPPEIQPPYWQPNGHLQTIIPALTRRVVLHAPQAVRLNTPDNDFLDLDYYTKKQQHLVIVTHGLEGSSKSPYLLGMVQTAMQAGADVIAWNFRGCSPAGPNNALRFYHSGATDDLHTVVLFALGLQIYRRITLIGFSLGGNLCLKYTGELGKGAASSFQDASRVLQYLQQTIVFSVPCNLAASSKYLERPQNFIYRQRFLKSLKNKIRLKAARYPDAFNLNLLDTIGSIRDFDEYFTAPLHGFKNADHYYSLNSSEHFITSLPIPTYLINARNDVFLPEPCFPFALAAASKYLHLIVPQKGGHCGFAMQAGTYWSEAFVSEKLKNNP